MLERNSPRQAALGLAAFFLVPLAAVADGSSIIEKGGANPAALPCVTCHGADGKGMAAAGFPRLAGLPSEYIAKQLRDFKAGSRMNPIMQPIASALSDAEVAAVAKSYSERPKVNAITPVNERPLPGSGAWIARRGAWERNIPECTLCHGPAGVGVGSSFPPLAGQSAAYIEAQLLAWRATPPAAAGANSQGASPAAPSRRNDPNGLMQHIAADLSVAEIKAVAEYFGSLGEASPAPDETQYRLR